MDYMWHTHHHQHQSGYTLPWLKQPTAQIFFNHHQTFHHNQQPNNLGSTTPSESENDKNIAIRRNSCDRIVPPAAFPFYKSSAFKPVLGAHRSQLFNDNLFNPSLLSSSLPPEPNSRVQDTDASAENEMYNNLIASFNSIMTFTKVFFRFLGKFETNDFIVGIHKTIPSQLLLTIVSMSQMLVLLIICPVMMKWLT